MLVLVVLILLRIAIGQFSSHFALEMVFDLLTLFLIWPLLRKVEINQAIQAWRYLRFRKNMRKKIQLFTAMILDGLRLMAIFYLFFWLLRWTRFDWVAGGSSVTPRDLNFLDTFFLCFFLSQVATSHKWSWWISKIPLSHGRQVIFHYLAAILIGTLLLLSPFSIKMGHSLPVVDGFFLAVSALSVTGLSTVDISQVLTQWGQLILLILIQLGGLGVIMVTAALSFAANQRLSLSSMLLGQAAFGTQHAGEMPKFLSKVVSLTLICEAFGALLLYYSLPTEMPNRFFNAVFHSVSAFCNAGFSLFPNSLHMSPLFAGGIVTICILIILGGLGFPIMFDIQETFKQNRISWERLSPHSKLTLSMMALLLVGGALLFFIFESIRMNSSLSILERLGQAVFYSISSRTAGYNMIPVQEFHLSAQFFLILLMIIGANPASTGGGVKTTTIGVLWVTVLSVLQGKTQSVIFSRSISFEIVKRALAIIFLYLSIAGFAITILSLTENINFVAIAFEVISALSTVGLSLGVTSQFSLLGKILLVILMLFGRIGILTAILAGVGQRKKSHVRYPEDEFFVG